MGLEELEELSAAVADPPTASLSLTDGNTAVLGFSEAVLDVSTAEPLTADTITVFVDGVPVTNAVVTRRNDTVYEIDLGLDAPAIGGEKLDVIIGATSIVGIRGGLVPRQRLAATLVDRTPPTLASATSAPPSSTRRPGGTLPPPRLLLGVRRRRIGRRARASDR